jgi:hypothetical protein
MQMSKPGICCDGCFALIAKKDTKAARLWLDLCEIQVNAQIMSTEVENGSLKLLEKFGFIVTTDTIDRIIIKVGGRKDDASGPFFCGGKCG